MRAALNTAALQLNLLIPGGDGEVADVRAAAGRIVPHLESGDEVEDVRRSDASACAVNREHGLPAHVVEINVLHHGASPVRQIEEIHARLIRVDARLDGHARHGLLAGEEQVEIARAPARSFLDDLRDGDAELLPLMLLLERSVRDQLAHLIRAEGLAHFVDRETHGAGRERGVVAVHVGRRELDGIRRAVQVEPRAGGGVRLMVENAEERNGLTRR